MRIDASCITNPEEIDDVLKKRKEGAPLLLEFIFDKPTMAYPKTTLGKEIYNQEPALPQNELEYYLSDTCMEN